MSLALLFGLIAAACYGTANFVARFSGKSLGVLVTLVWSQLFLLAVTSIVFLIFGKLPHVDPSQWAILVASNVLVVLGTSCLYMGLATGRLSLVAPVMASYGAVTAVLSVVTGEKASVLMLTGLALTVAGAVLSAVPSKAAKSSGKSGLWFALGSAMCFGIGYWLQGNYVIPTFGPIPTIWLCYLTAACLFGLTALIRRESLFTFDGPKDIGLLLGTATLSGSGFGAMMVAQSDGDIAIATALSSTATAITVILAFVFLKDKPGLAGWMGVAAVVAGIVTLQLGAAS